MHIRLVSKKRRISLAQETEPDITALQNQLITALFGAMLFVLPAYQELMDAKSKETTIG